MISTPAWKYLERMSNLPIVVENGIPITLFEATAIDGPNTSIDAIHADFVWSKPYHSAFLKMGAMYLSILMVGKASP